MDNAKFIVTVDKRTDKGLASYKMFPAKSTEEALDLYNKILEGFPVAEFSVGLHQVDESGKLEMLACNYLSLVGKKKVKNQE